MPHLSRTFWLILWFLETRPHPPDVNNYLADATSYSKFTQGKTKCPAASLGNLVIFYNRPYFAHFLDGTKTPEKACVGGLFCLIFVFERSQYIILFV